MYRGSLFQLHPFKFNYSFCIPSLKFHRITNTHTSFLVSFLNHNNMSTGDRGRGQSGRGRGRGRAGGPISGPRSGSPTSSHTGSVGSRGRGGGPFPPRGGYGPPQNRGRGAGGPPRIFNAGVPARADDRLSKRNIDSLVDGFKRLNLSPEMPLRPGWGTKGIASLGRSNFFAVTLPKDLKIYDYKVSFTPSRDLRGGRKARLFQLLESSPQFTPFISHIAHDRAQRIVSSRKLPQPLIIPVTFYEEELPAPREGAEVYTLTIEFDRQLDSNDIARYTEGRPERRNDDILPIVSALNLVLQQHAARTGVRVGKNKYFFPSSEERYPLSLGLEARKGFFLSVRPTFKQLMVNINVCMTAFYIPGNLVDAMQAFQNQSRGGMPNEFADQLKILTKHLGYPKKKTILRIVGKPPSQVKFYWDKIKAEVTVAEFFKREYKITLRFPNEWPVIDVAGRSAKQPVYLPPELCEIMPNQAWRGILSDTATSSMIKVACNPPHVNGESIVNQGFPALGLDPSATRNPVAGFGIKVSKEMATIPLRILPAPSLSYKVGRPNVKDASWNILNVRFHVGGDMNGWAVLLVKEGKDVEFRAAGDPQLGEFLTTFAAKCRSSGMVVPEGLPKILETPRLPPPHQDPSRREALNMIEKTIRNGLNPKKKPSFVLVLLSGRDNWVYPAIKRMGDVMYGFHTVHMLLPTARKDPKKQDQYFSNIALKVNVKLGGINHQLDRDSMSWLKSKSMLVGIDVTKPGPKSRPGSPSIAAVVASYDDRHVHFPASLSPQRNRNIDRDSEEMVQDLAKMMIERLLLYQKKNKNELPERIFVFRDGVSEGEYPKVIQYELPQFFAAFSKFKQSTYKPKLTIIVCGKRHNTRQWATDTQHMSRNGNTLPGTVVDQGITDVYNFDFYLQAHNGLQGHVKPTHYTVVYDENYLDADTIQCGTNATSYLYARATKAVSLCPPAYYADLACERARFYIFTFLNIPDNKSVASGDSKGKSREEKDQERREEVYQAAMKLWGKGIHKDLEETMFYI
ncbi:Piwi-domain-containing protein [Abortiporus biennis]|nr:Piwi-domain-containing protein [Abortiporus biennis]